MKKTKAIAAFLSAAVLAGACSTSASAALLPTDGEPLAETLYQLLHDENIFSYASCTGQYGYTFFSEDAFHVYNLTELYYEITVEPGTELPDDLSEQLLTTLENENNTNKRVVCDTEKDEDGKLNPISFVQKDDATYVFRLSTYSFLVNDEALTQLWQTIPGFVSIEKNAVGYDLTDVGVLLGYDKKNGYFDTDFDPFGICGIIVQTMDDSTLSVDDFPEDLHIIEVKYDETCGGYYGGYYVKPDLTPYSYVVEVDDEYIEEDFFINYCISNAEMYRILTEIDAMDKVESVSMWFSILESVIDVDAYKIDNGAITLATRGDCDRDDKVTIYDAYRALISSSLEALGESSHLTDREYAAADVNGDGKVSMNDAYDILMYSSGQYLGTDTSWADILQ